MITVNIKVENLEKVQRLLNNLGDKIENPGEKLFNRLKAAGMEDIDQRFMSRGYGTWPSLSPRTIKRKGHSFVLVDTGAMLSSAKAYRRGNRIFIRIPYGGRTHNPDVPRYHQTGTRRMPQRKIIEVTPQLRMRLRNTVVEYVHDMVRAYRTEM
jgi:hypothetical protein